MKIALILVTAFSLFFGTFLTNQNSKIMNAKPSIYDISLTGLTGEKIDLSTFKGKKILIVNTASECGFTKQFADLQKLHEKYKDKLVIIGVPCNQFGGQEPGNAQEIQSFCQVNYGVTFLMTEKVDVKGESQHPLYQWLTKKELNGVKSSSVKWNFQKYLIDEQGNLLDYYFSLTNPMSSKITKQL
jgi:glutathione peroxidase